MVRRRNKALPVDAVRVGTEEVGELQEHAGRIPECIGIGEGYPQANPPQSRGASRDVEVELTGRVIRILYGLDPAVVDPRRHLLAPLVVPVGIVAVGGIVDDAEGGRSIRIVDLTGEVAVDRQPLPAEEEPLRT